MEMEEEQITNRLQRQLESLLAAHRTLEARVEARGIRLADLGLAPWEQREAQSDVAWAYASGLERSGSRGSSELARGSLPSELGRVSINSGGSLGGFGVRRDRRYSNSSLGSSPKSLR